MGKRNRSNREPAQAWTASAALLHSASNVPHRLRTVPRTSSQASNARYLWLSSNTAVHMSADPGITCAMLLMHATV